VTLHVSAPTRRQQLERHLAAALAGDSPMPLFELLARHGRLPAGPINAGLLEEWGAMTSDGDDELERFLKQMGELDAELAQGGTAYEFLPVAAVLALGTRAARHPDRRDKLFRWLHGRADDLRYRVREAVIEALVRIGERSPEDLLHRSSSWMDGFFHGAAVLRALADDRVIDRVDDAALLVERVEAALALCDGANRSTSRYPGYKEVVATLEAVAPRLAKRFGAPVLRAFEAHAGSSKPEIRALVVKLAEATSHVGRQKEEARAMKKTLAATAKKPRDPRAEKGPTRQRSKRGG
jgi:hypothetical protein